MKVGDNICLIEGHHRMTALFMVWQLSLGVAYSKLPWPKNMTAVSEVTYKQLQKEYRATSSSAAKFVLPEIKVMWIKSNCDRTLLYNWCFHMFFLTHLFLIKLLTF